MKKNIIGLIMCGIAIVLLIAGTVLMFFNDKGEDNPKKDAPPVSTSTYTVTLKDSEGFKLDAVPYNGDNEVALFITSPKDYSNISIEATMLDSANQVVSTSSDKYYFVGKDRKFVLSTTVDSNAVKSIEVKVVPEEDTIGNTVILDKNKLSFDSNITVGDSNIATITLTATNPYDQAINLVSGFVELYNNDKLVDMVPFGVSSVDQNGSISTTVNTNLHNTTGIISYDKIVVFVNELF